VELDEALYEITVYSSCCNTDRGIYYYTTYDNSKICGIDMHKEDLQKDTLIWYPLQKEQAISIQNG
jgi:choloylglycine hydrolase